MAHLGPILGVLRPILSILVHYGPIEGMLGALGLEAHFGLFWPTLSTYPGLWDLSWGVWKPI